MHFWTKAHSELLSAADNLLQLADWCDESFVQEETSNVDVKYFPDAKLPNKLYGGKTLKTTGQFASQVILSIEWWNCFTWG